MASKFVNFRNKPVDTGNDAEISGPFHNMQKTYVNNELQVSHVAANFTFILLIICLIYTKSHDDK